LVTTKDVPPGGVGEIKATFKSKGYQGTVKKAITVETNDPKNRSVRLILKGSVVPDVTVEPRHLNFGRVNRYELPAPVELKIQLREGKGLRIKEVTSENDSIVLRKKHEDEKGAVYLVSLSDKVTTGRLTGRIEIRTNSKKSSKIQVPFYATVEGSVKVSPQLVSFAVVQPGEPTTRELTLTKTGKSNFSIEGIEASAKEISTKVVTENEGEKYRIEVTYDPGDKTKGRIAEKLTILVKSAEEEKIEVPVYGTIYDKRNTSARKNM